MNTAHKTHYGFTIVELLIVIVVIAILAAISIVAYNGVQRQANETALKSDLSNAAKQLGIVNAQDEAYPVNGDALTASPNTVFNYKQLSGGTGYCLEATNARLPGVTYSVSSTNDISDEACPSSSTPPQPLASAKTIKGGLVPGNPCTPASCSYVSVQTSNFPAGPYQVRCLSGGNVFSSNQTAVQIPANGVKQLSCYTSVAVEIVGWGMAQAVTW
jgi:general secretion pathway protein G